MYGVHKDFYSYVLKFYLILMGYSDDKNGPKILNALSKAFNKKKKRKKERKGCIPNSSCESRVLHSKEDSVNQGTELNRQEWDTPDGWKDPKWCALMLEQIRKIVLINSLNTHTHTN